MAPRRTVPSRPPAGKKPRASRRPWMLGAAVAILTATPLIPSESVAETGAGLFLILFWLLLLLAWAAQGVLGGPGRVRVDAALLTVGLLVGAVALSAGIMAWNGNPRATINSAWQWGSFAVAFFLMRQWIRSAVEQRAVCVVMVGLAVALAVFGYYEYFVTKPATRARFQADPEAVYRAAGLGSNPDPQVVELLRNRVESVEPIATFALTNSFAGFLAPWLVMAVGIGSAFWQNRFQRPRRVWCALAVVLVLLGGCLLLTKSRTAWVAVASGLVLLVAYGRPVGRRLSGWIPIVGISAVIVVFLATLMMGGLDAEVLTEAPKSLLYRVEYWQATAAMILDHPWWGVGVGNFQDYYTAYKLPQASETVADPHNFLLEIAATSGIFAFLAWCAFCVALVLQLRGSLASEPRKQQNEAIARGPTGSASPSDASAETATIYLVYAGALLGVLLGVPISFAAGYPLDATLIWLGLPIGMLCVGLLHPWTSGGRLPAVLPVIALAVMLINFLAAGGIGFASVATSFWLLTAVALASWATAGRWLEIGRGMAIFTVALAVLLLLAFYFSAYRPTLAANTAIQRAEDAIQLGRRQLAEQELRAAAAADPFAPQSRQNLASLFGDAWISGSSAAAREAFEAAWPEAVRRNQRSYGLWKSIGDYYFQAYEKDSQPEILKRSIDAGRMAIALYPTRAPLRVELAWRLHLADDQAAAAEQAEIALALDRQNPHIDQKLAKFPAPQNTGARNLEHLAEKLRKLVGTGRGDSPTPSSPSTSSGSSH